MTETRRGGLPGLRISGLPRLPCQKTVRLILRGRACHTEPTHKGGSDFGWISTYLGIGFVKFETRLMIRLRTVWRHILPLYG